MKNKLYLILTAFVVLMCSCNSTSSRIDYLPCQVDEDEDWGFVNAKGEVFCRDAFTNQPSEVRDGIFFVKEGQAYSMYQFDEKKPKLLLEDIVDFGCITNGLVPICKNDSRIEIVDTEGSTKFVLDKIDDKEVISCAPAFEYGYLNICILDDEGEKRYGIIDESGNIVISPKYQKFQILGSNLFYVESEEDEEESQFFIDKAEKKQTQWKNGLDIRYISEQYIVASNNDHFCVYDMKGNEVLKCPSKIEYIRQLKNGFLVFSGEDYDLSDGVMDLKGEVILPAKYEDVTIVDNGFIAEKENGDVQLYDTKGNLIAEIKDDIEYLENVEGFGNLRMDGRHYYLLDDNFNAVNKVEFDLITTPTTYGDVSSEYFDINAVIRDAKNALESDLKNNIGKSVTSLSFITSKGTSKYKSDTKYVTYWFGRGVKYSVDVTFTFDYNILTPIYKEKKVTHEDLFWGTYHTTEKVIDGYNFNENALLKQVTIECSVPDSKKEEINKLLSSYLEEYAEYDSGGNLFKDNYRYYISGVSILIGPYGDDFASVPVTF